MYMYSTPKLNAHMVINSVNVYDIILINSWSGYIFITYVYNVSVY